MIPELVRLSGLASHSAAKSASAELSSGENAAKHSFWEQTARICRTFRKRVRLSAMIFCSMRTGVSSSELLSTVPFFSMVWIRPISLSRAIALAAVDFDIL